MHFSEISSTLHNNNIMGYHQASDEGTVIPPRWNHSFASTERPTIFSQPEPALLATYNLAL